MSNNLLLEHSSVDGASVIFLEQEPIESLHSYALGINSTGNETVSASLNRAVARVDVLFIQSKKNEFRYDSKVDNGWSDEGKLIEMTMTNVRNLKMIDGDYSSRIEVAKHISVNPTTRSTQTDKDLTVIIGTFPTTTGTKSAFRLKLYRNGAEEPWYNETVTDTLTVQRNQLLDIAAHFEGDIPSFEVLINTDWDSSNPGGETDIN